MVSLRFPFSFSQSGNTRFPSGAFSPATITCSVAISAAVGARISADISISQNSTNQSLSDGSGAVITESKTGVSFPAVLKDSQGLLGIGLRKKAVLGLKNIDFYAFVNQYSVDWAFYRKYRF